MCESGSARATRVLEDFTKGSHALHAAAAVGNVDLCSVLIDRDPSLLHERDNNGWTAIDTAVYFRHRGVQRVLMECFGRIIALGHAVDDIPSATRSLLTHHEYHALTVQFCRQKLLPWDAINIPCPLTGRTALHYVVMQHQIDNCQLLLGNGAVQVADRNGATPLHIAAMYNCSQACGMLLRAGASTTALTCDHCAGPLLKRASPLATAVYMGNLDVCCVLVASGHASLEASDNGHHDLREIAASAGHMHIVEFLDECARAESPRVPLRPESTPDGMHEGAAPTPLRMRSELERMLDAVVSRSHGSETRVAEICTSLVPQGSLSATRLLEAAIRRGSVQICECLIRKGGVAGIESGLCKLLTLALNFKRWAVFDLLRCHCNSGADGKGEVEAALFQSLLTFLSESDFDSADVLHGRGVDLDTRRSDGNTLLHCIAENAEANDDDLLKTCEWLVKRGADTRKPDLDGLTCADIASRRGFDAFSKIVTSGAQEPPPK